VRRPGFGAGLNIKAREEIVFNAEIAETAEEKLKEFSACSAHSALNVAFLVW